MRLDTHVAHPVLLGTPTIV